jgi:hypothetical protein
MSQMGQTRLGRADGKSGHVGYPPIATGFFGAATFRDVHRTGHVRYFLSTFVQGLERCPCGIALP